MTLGNDPYTKFNFLVEIVGITTAGFKECTGLESETDIIEYREGARNATPRQLPGLTRYSNIVLKRGVTDALELEEQRQLVKKRYFEKFAEVLLGQQLFRYHQIETKLDAKKRHDWTSIIPLVPVSE